MEGRVWVQMRVGDQLGEEFMEETGITWVIEGWRGEGLKKDISSEATM